MCHAVARPLRALTAATATAVVGLLVPLRPPEASTRRLPVDTHLLLTTVA